MENKFLINLTIKYGLDEQSLVKVVDTVHELGYDDVNNSDFQRAATYICSMGLIEMSSESLIEEMKRKGFGEVEE